MAARPVQGGASAPSERLSRLDWISLAWFLFPLIAATIHSLAGGAQ